MRDCRHQLLISSLFAAVLATEVVTVLSDFNTLLANDGTTVVRYGTKWCRHCKTMQKEWDAFATAMVNSPVTLIDVDCTVTNEICIENEIYRFPSVLVYEGGQKAYKFPDYEDRTVENFMTMLYVVGHPEEVYGLDEVMPLAAHKSFLKVVANTEQVTLVAFCDNTCGNYVADEFDQLALQIPAFEGKIRLASVNCADSVQLCQAEHITMMPTYKFYRGGMEVGERLIGSRSTDKLLADLYKLLLTLFAQPRVLVSSQGRSMRFLDALTSITGIDVPEEIVEIVDDVDEIVDVPVENVQPTLTTQQELMLQEITVNIGMAANLQDRPNGVNWCEGLVSESNECWYFDTSSGQCFLREGESCLDLQCEPNQMSGHINPDVFTGESVMNNTEGELSRSIKFQKRSNEPCNITMDYERSERGFKFTIPLGECGMRSNDQDGTITFTENLAFITSTETPGVQFSGNLRLRCAYQTAISTDIYNFDTTVKRHRHTQQAAGTWDGTFDISFYEDKSYKNLTDPDDLYIGQSIYAKVFPKIAFSPSFPVKFYLNRCVIRSLDGRYNFNVIDNGCVSNLVEAELHSDVPYQQGDIKFSFVSFAFVQTEATYNMGLKCDIVLCITKDIESGTCGIGRDSTRAINGQSQNEHTCIDGYTPFTEDAGTNSAVVAGGGVA